MHIGKTANRQIYKNGDIDAGAETILVAWYKKTTKEISITV